MDARLAIRAEQSVDAVQPTPKKCLDFPDGQWMFLARSQACSVEPYVLYVEETVNGAKTITGTIEFLLRYYVYGGPQLTTWAHQVEVQPLLITGTAVGTIVTGTRACIIHPKGVGGACGTDEATFTPATLAVGKIAGGEAFQTFSGAGPSWGSGHWKLTMKPPRGNSVSAEAYSFPIRCDAIVAKAGCVFPEFTPAIT